MEETQNNDCAYTPEETDIDKTDEATTQEDLAFDCCCEPNHNITCDCCCEVQQDVTFDVCEDVRDVTVQDVGLKCEGRLLKVRVKLNDVCAGRKIMIGVMICEQEQSGVFKTRGFRTCEITVPGELGRCVDKVCVEEFCFVLSEDDLCRKRKVKVNIIAHYSSFPSFPYCFC